jgi:hypothetical protein
MRVSHSRTVPSMRICLSRVEDEVAGLEGQPIDLFFKCIIALRYVA